MPTLFWDSSALIKRYVAEIGTDTTNVLFSAPLPEEIGLPTEEERENSGGWWEARTLESINAFRLGVPAFFCYIAKEHGENIDPLTQLTFEERKSCVEIRWI